MSVTQPLLGTPGAALSLMVKRLSTPGYFLDWTGSTGTPPAVDVSACVFSQAPAAKLLTLVEAAEPGQFPIQLAGTILSQWTDGKYAFLTVDAAGNTVNGVQVDISGGTDWTASKLPMAGGIVIANTPGVNGTITLSGYLPGPSGSYAPSGVFGTAAYVPGRPLYFTAGTLVTVKTAPCTAHVNHNDGTATFTFAIAPTVSPSDVTNRAAEAVVLGS